MFAADMSKLEDLGFGRVITLERMKADKIVGGNKACAVFLKPHYMFLDSSFFRMARGKDVSRGDYIVSYEQDLDEFTRTVVEKYHPHRNKITGIRQEPSAPKPKIVTALDLLTPLQGIH